MTRSGSWLVAALTLAFSFEASAGELVVTFLGNEGFHIKAESGAAIVDGMMTEEAYGYPPTEASAWQAMLAKASPYERVDIVLSSHWHEDHFQPAAAAAFLVAHPESTFAAPTQIIERLEAHPEADKLRALDPKSGELPQVEAGGVTVKACYLAHGEGRYAEIMNLGNIVEVDGFRVFHAGDAHPEFADLTACELYSKPVDVAIFPYFFFTAERKEAIFAKIKARQFVAAHFPTDITSSDFQALLADIRKNYPDAVIALDRGFAWSLESAN
jgi:L-ascorbate metabolism protein UlaG (beta-lactamase superfamily)